MKQGVHELEILEPDLVLFRIRGAVLTADSEALAMAIKEHRQGDMGYLMSVIETDAFDMPPDARKAFIQHMKGIPAVTDAVVGASFHVRVIGRIVATGARVLAKSSLRLGFFDDERSARVWLGEQGCVACRAPTSGGGEDG